MNSRTAPDATPFDAVVLAGGRAARLGGADKPGLRVGGRALLDRVLAACAGAGTTVVVAAPRPTPRPVVWAREEPAGGGPVAALDAGLRSTSAELVLVLSADLPFLRERTVRRLIAALDAAGVAGVAGASDVAGAAGAAGAAGTADGVMLTDPDGRDQPLVAVYRSAPLRKALAALAAGADSGGDAVSGAVSVAGTGSAVGTDSVASTGSDRGADPDAGPVLGARARADAETGAGAEARATETPRVDASVRVDASARVDETAQVGAAPRTGAGRSGRGLAGMPLRRLTARLELVRITDPLAAFDCDTWGDIAAARARIREHGHVLDEWITAVKDELGIELDVDTGTLLDLARDAAHGVARPAAPLTTFLVGYAAAQDGAGGGGPQAVAEAARKAAVLAARWADENQPDEARETPAPGADAPSPSDTRPDTP